VNNLERQTLLTMTAIKQCICACHGLPFRKMTERDAMRYVSHPRQEAMYLSRVVARKSLNQIGRSFQRDHTTVIHACRAVEKRKASDPYFASRLLNIAVEMLP
jgi:chromosomal replication initiator protein